MVFARLLRLVKKTYHYIAVRNNNKIKVTVKKCLYGGIQFPEKFKLKNKDDKYLSYNEYNSPYIFTNEISRATVFYASENLNAKNNYAIFENSATPKSIHYFNNAYISSDNMESSFFEFRLLYLDLPKIVLINSKSEEFFEVVPIEKTYISDEKIKIYSDSCKKLSQTKDIKFDDYIDHMKNLFNILHTYTNNSTDETTSNSNYTFGFYLFDEHGINDFKNSYPQLCHKLSSNIIYQLTFDNEISNLDYDVKANTIMHKNIYIQVKKIKDDVMFYFNHNKVNNIDLELKKNMSILPKYIYVVHGDIFTINTSIIENLKIINHINETFFHINDYNIICDNKKNYTELFHNLIKYTQSEHANNMILCTIINNIYNEKHNIDDYYYYFRYDGPYPYASILNYQDYMKQNIHKYQPLNINEYNINNVYISYTDWGTTSRPLNMYLQKLLEKINNLDFTEYIKKQSLSEKTNHNDNEKDIITRLEKMMNVYINTKKPKNSYKMQDIYLFHGTQKSIHDLVNLEINIKSYFSCTFDLYTAYKYAITDDIVYDMEKDKHKKGYIYILKISDKIKYINFLSTQKELILLPGTKIQILFIFILNNITYHMCTVKANADENYDKNLYKIVKYLKETPKT